jgi:hypothetical protein
MESSTFGHVTDWNEVIKKEEEDEMMQILVK